MTYALQGLKLPIFLSHMRVTMSNETDWYQEYEQEKLARLAAEDDCNKYRTLYYKLKYRHEDLVTSLRNVIKIVGGLMKEENISEEE